MYTDVLGYDFEFTYNPWSICITQLMIFHLKYLNKKVKIICAEKPRNLKFIGRNFKKGHSK